MAQLAALEVVLHPSFGLWTKQLGTAKLVEDKVHWLAHILLRLLAMVSLVLTGVSWCGGMWFVGDYLRSRPVGLALAVLG